jgi:gag-polyprotein putative aspartyl protease
MKTNPASTIITRNIRSPSITFKVKLVGKLSGKQISANALLDSGAEGMIIHERFVEKHQLSTKLLNRPLPAQNVDGTQNAHGYITHSTVQRLRISNISGAAHDEQAEFLITNVGEHDIILGTDWLRHHNPDVDWTKDSLTFNHCPRTCLMPEGPITVYSMNTVHKGLVQTMTFPEEEEPPFDELGALVFTDTELKDTPIVDHQIRIAFLQWKVRIQAKTTTSTRLADNLEVPRRLEDLIPPQFLKWRRIFDDQAAQRLPSHAPWDHAINLKPNAIRKDCGVYRLTPKEQVALKEYLDKHLKRGTIRPSSAPVASPFFFVEKKGGSLRPVQDYRALNNATIKDAYPLPLIPELIDKLQDARYFTKFDVRWGYNNI